MKPVRKKYVVPSLQVSNQDQGWRIGRTTMWAVAICATLAGGYFYGLHKEAAGVATVAGNRSIRSVAPDQAQNGIPIAPSLTDGSAPADLLARAQVANELLYTDLEAFVCSEQMERYQGRLNGESPHRIDTVNARISFENGVENYTDIHQNNRQRTSLSSLAGAWSEGEFGTLLRQTRALLPTQPVSLQPNADLNGVPSALYSFDVSGQASPWDLSVKSQQFRVPFRTNIWVSKSSGQILKIARQSSAMPPDSGISEIQWSVMLKPVEMDGKSWLLPSSGDYSVLYERSNHREWNVIEFSGYQHYASRSIIHF